MRIAILGNAGSGKSTLAKRLAVAHGLPLHEVDRLQWNADWTLVAAATYRAAHDAVIAGQRWIMDGPGRLDGLAERLDRATHVILCDIPLWQNYWLMAERQAAWGRGELALRPGGHETPPSTRDLFEFVWSIDRDYMPKWRALVDACAEDTTVLRVTDVAELAELRLDGSRG
ncbi:P-loop NTPase family protein [Roseicyclus sp.]